MNWHIKIQEFAVPVNGILMYINTYVHVDITLITISVKVTTFYGVNMFWMKLCPP